MTTRGVDELIRLARAEPADDRDLATISRRTLFKLAGAGAAVAGLAACSSRPAREIRPYVAQPPELTPGVAQHYATALVEDGFAFGVIAEAHEGRPTKLEGNPDHPASLGATRAIEQAAVLALYDPHRLHATTDRGAPVAASQIATWLGAARATGGAGVHVLAEPSTSLVLADALARVRAALPAITVTWWSPLSPRAQLAGNALAFGRPLQTQLALGGADVVVALDADLVADHPMAVAYARQLADRRRVTDERSPMSRIYVVEPTPTATGVLADHRFAVRGLAVAQIAAELEAALHGGAAPTRWVAAMAADLRRAAGRSVVVAGERQPAAVHAAVARINDALGNAGKTVSYTEPVAIEGGQASHSLDKLAGALGRREVRQLIVVGGDPAYTAPAPLDLARAIAEVPSLYLGVAANATSAACRFVVPGQHVLEQWDLARAYDGTLTPIQPLIEPLFDGQSPAELLGVLAGAPPIPARDRMRAVWAAQSPTIELDAALALGCVPASAAPAVAVTLQPGALPAPALPPLELDVRPHPLVHDGRYATNPWLLELPEPITKLSWDNAAQLSPATAARLDIAAGQVIALTADGRTLEVPAIVVPGHADDAITLHTGYGQQSKVGANAFALWTGPFQLAVTVVPGDRTRELAKTQQEWTTEGRPIVPTGSLAQLATPAFRAELAAQRGDQPSVLAIKARVGQQWAMSIDLTTCTGCTACVMACVAENNTPVVGRGRVLNNREMHWLRIDRYVDDGGTYAMQPMACQHCEDAPCEYVCPVGATTHSPDGLNEMTYNRCIGTRFCSNNCPYKVRRFNWFDFKQHDGPQVLARNPDVTVRDRGVMEKCTYCVQRIRRTEIDARIAGRAIATGEVRTACQQACPTQAIAFGSITDAGSSVTEQRGRPHSYEALHDQGTRPRTTYLARIRNPNPELA